MKEQNLNSGSLSPKWKRCDPALIHEQDLRDAIAECQGKRNPDANTCIKLAAYLTILNNLYPEEKPNPNPDPGAEFYQMASGTTPDPVIEYDSGTEFSKMVHGRSESEIMPVMDELMETIKFIHPRLYKSVLNKLH